MEVCARLMLRDFLRYPADLHLTLDGMPREMQTHPRIATDVAALPALVIGEEDKALIIHGLQQHNTLTGLPLLVHCGNHHGIGIWQLHINRILHPAPE